jgi:hypothetical protein
MIVDMFNPAPDGADALEEGCYLFRRGPSGRIDIPLRIWFGPPQNPDAVDAPPLDRSPRWQVEINGGLYGDPDQPVFIGNHPVETLVGIWPNAKLRPTTREDYDYRVARADHAALYDADDPFAITGGRVDPMTSTLP